MERLSLTALLYALKEEVIHAWMRSMVGERPSLATLEQSFDNVQRELRRLEESEEGYGSGV